MTLKHIKGQIMITKGYDKIAKDYDNEFIGKGASNSDLAENNLIFAVCQGYMNELGHGIITDLGCGTGYILDHIKLGEDKFKYVGIDISREMIDIARLKRGNANTHLTVRDIATVNELVVNSRFVVSTFGSFSYVLNYGSIDWGLLCAPDATMFLMLFGEQYKPISTHKMMGIDEDAVSVVNWTARRAHSYFTPWFKQVEIRGFRSKYLKKLIEFLPKKTPVIILFWLYYLDIASIGSLFPDKCDYLLVTAKGTKVEDIENA